MLLDKRFLKTIIQTIKEPEFMDHGLHEHGGPPHETDGVVADSDLIQNAGDLQLDLPTE